MTIPLTPPATAEGTHPRRARRIRRARADAVEPLGQAVTPPEALWRYAVISSFLHGASTDSSLRQRLQ
jgi:hypothetical protein